MTVLCLLLRSPLPAVDCGVGGVRCTQDSRQSGSSGHRSSNTQQLTVDTDTMTEEYLLAWNDHHSTFFTAMSELVSG